jgi:hypothetical protein
MSERNKSAPMKIANRNIMDSRELNGIGLITKARIVPKANPSERASAHHFIGFESHPSAFM